MAGNGSGRGTPDVDVVVVGAGMAGLYLLYRLRTMGFSAVAVETADDVGGTWYWNRYPGARCDIMTVDYSYSFDPELDEEWQWSEKYATQPEILRYLGHVADKHDLRRDIRFSTKVDRAVWDDDASLWRVHTVPVDGGDETELTCRFYVMATGCLSVPKEVDIEGTERFTGDVYSTGRWPHEGVDFTGKRVAVIGTGSSAIQSIPLIAEQAAQLTVYQRTPNFSRPAKNGPVPPQKLDAYAADPAAYREAARYSRAGVPVEDVQIMALQVSEEERQAAYEAFWESGDLIPPLYADILVNPAANETLCEFLRGKIRSIVKDPETAEALCPTNHYYGTKRPCIDTNYFETFNQPHVKLVDLRRTPITTITETGIETTAGAQEFDAIVFATGFDAMTGAIVAVDIRGHDGLPLADKWADGPKTYLGLTTVGFPNYFMITGPGSPSVLSNMAVSIEQHVEWVTDCMAHMRHEGLTVVEPTSTAEDGWVQHVNDCADITLHPTANSWYMGANVPGKPHVFLPYIGGVDVYRRTCEEVVHQDYLGFAFTGPDGVRCHDGVVNRLQPDVAMVLQMLEELGIPPIESMSVEEARAFTVAMAAERPPGPEVGEIVDGTFPGAAGDLAYRLYRPATPGPHPIVVYFHGGGWVLGAHDSDDPLCRDLCVRTDAVVVSCDYRHAPEVRFPAAAEDGVAAVQWVAANAEALGGDPDRLAVAGWSAGAHTAAVACQLARDAGGPAIVAQLLLTPVTDFDLDRPSFVENAEGYILTTALMQWFWDHYADEAERSHAQAAPIRGNLAGLPPAIVITAEFDPLRDEGAAYVDALGAAGVDARLIQARGHTHTSLTMVDAVLSGAPVRAEFTEAFRQLLSAPVPA